MIFALSLAPAVAAVRPGDRVDRPVRDESNRVDAVDNTDEALYSVVQALDQTVATVSALPQLSADQRAATMRVALLTHDIAREALGRFGPTLGQPKALRAAAALQTASAFLRRSVEPATERARMAQVNAAALDDLVCGPSRETVIEPQPGPELAQQAQDTVAPIATRLAELINYDYVVLPEAGQDAFAYLDDTVTSQAGTPDEICKELLPAAPQPTPAAPTQTRACAFTPLGCGHLALVARPKPFRGCHPAPSAPHNPGSPIRTTTTAFGDTAEGDAYSFCDPPPPKNTVIFRTHRTCLGSRPDFQPPAASTPWTTRRCAYAYFPGIARQTSVVRWYCRNRKDWYTRDEFQVFFNGVPDPRTIWSSSAVDLSCKRT